MKRLILTMTHTMMTVMVMTMIVAAITMIRVRKRKSNIATNAKKDAVVLLKVMTEISPVVTSKQ